MSKNHKFAQNIDIQTLISDNLDKIKTLCMAHNVKTLFAFGSVCTDKFNDKSDIDLLVSFNNMDYGDYADTYFELDDKFENLFHRQVDLITDKSRPETMGIALVAAIHFAMLIYYEN